MLPRAVFWHSFFYSCTQQDVKQYSAIDADVTLCCFCKTNCGSKVFVSQPLTKSGLISCDRQMNSMMLFSSLDYTFQKLHKQTTCFFIFRFLLKLSKFCSFFSFFKWDCAFFPTEFDVNKTLLFTWTRSSMTKKREALQHRGQGARWKLGKKEME